MVAKAEFNLDGSVATIVTLQFLSDTGCKYLCDADPTARDAGDPYCTRVSAGVRNTTTHLASAKKRFSGRTEAIRLEIQVLS